jgi:hypothetical protein
MLQLTIPGFSSPIPEPSGFIFAGSGSTIGSIVSRALKFVFPIAGLILFIFLLLGGLELLTSTGNEEKIKSGKNKIVSALIGFVIIFVAFWLVQLLQAVFGLEKIF